MVARAQPRVHGERPLSSTWSSDYDTLDDDDLIVRVTRFSPASPTSTPSPSHTTPVRTDYGPSSVQLFVQESIESAKADGRLVEQSTLKSDPISQRTLRPRPRTSLDDDQLTMAIPSKIPEDATGNGSSSNRRRLSRRRSRQMEFSTDGDLIDTDQAPAKPKSRKAKAAKKEVQKDGNATNSRIGGSLLERLSSLIDGPPSKPRRKSAAPSDVSEVEDTQPSRPLGGGLLLGKSPKKDVEDSNQQVSAWVKTGKALKSVADKASAKQPNGSIAATPTSSQALDPSLRADLEAFQQKERRQFAPSLSVDTSPDSIQPDRGENLGNSRKNDFEQESTAKRQSWRHEENSSSNKRQSGNAGDLDEDSPRVRKPPRRQAVFPVSRETTIIPSDRNNAGLSHNVQIQHPTPDLSILVDGLREDLLAAVPSDLPASSATNLNIGELTQPLSERRVVLSFDIENAEFKPAAELEPSERRNKTGRRAKTEAPASQQHKQASSKKTMSVLPVQRQSTIVNLPPFNYNAIVPEAIPNEMFEANNNAVRARALMEEESHGRKNLGDSLSTSTKVNKLKEFREKFAKDRSHTGMGSVLRPKVSESRSLELENPYTSWPRVWTPVLLPVQPNDPRVCPLGALGQGWIDGEARSSDILNDICEFLSHQDVQNLRLVSRNFAEVVTPILFRSVVTNFGRTMFDVNMSKYDRKSDVPSSKSPFQKFGPHMNKFGVSFEIDLKRLEDAKPKIISKQEKSWFGNYDWPVAEYPHFKELQLMEDLVDNNTPVLRDVLKYLSNASELALSIDSGHGWLNGPDVSDLAVYRMRRDGGTPVFGKNFKGVNKWHDHTIDLLLQWAQKNTANQLIKDIYHDGRDRTSEFRFLRTLVVRRYETFRKGIDSDFDEYQHIGHKPSTNPINHNHNHNPGPPPPPHFGPTTFPLMPAAAGTGQNQQQALAALFQYHVATMGLNRRTQQAAPVPESERNSQSKSKDKKTHPQWPIIFNGYNVAAQVGGSSASIQSKLSNPQSYPLRPGELTEAQAQWLMETMWAQRGFLSAYTTAIIMNKANLGTIHSLHIAKLSSGLLPSLAQREFWGALKGLKALTILISPDWRTEHIPGDRAFNFSMAIAPVTASVKFAEFLSQHVAQLENLSSLTIGFVGGGEHAPGMRARNQNILPAPITLEPNRWVTDNPGKPDMGTMMKFDHIQTLTFKNCWFSPCMLEGFMTKSVDTSLRHLILDSVSLTGVHIVRADPILASNPEVRVKHGLQAWLQEDLPYVGCWSTVLDRLTPGTTFFERKVAAGMIDSDRAGLPESQRQFRGNVEKITLKSCGYVKISGVSHTDFNQHTLVISNTDGMVDEGLRIRKALLEFDERINITDRRGPPHVLRANNTFGERYRGRTKSEEVPKHQRIMQSRLDPSTGSEYFGLGTLTQVVAPVEKRILEQAWGMHFGWGDDVERWAAVEDGWYEGGTGRFSGVITKEAEGGS